jgi:hypothetical protein
MVGNSELRVPPQVNLDPARRRFGRVHLLEANWGVAGRNEKLSIPVACSVGNSRASPLTDRFAPYISEGAIQGSYAKSPARVAKPVAQIGGAPTLRPGLQGRILFQGAFDLLGKPTPHLPLSHPGLQALRLAIEQAHVAQVCKIQIGQMFASFRPLGIQQPL